MVELATSITDLHSGPVGLGIVGEPPPISQSIHHLVMDTHTLSKNAVKRGIIKDRYHMYTPFDQEREATAHVH